MLKQLIKLTLHHLGFDIIRRSTRLIQSPRPGLIETKRKIDLHGIVSKRSTGVENHESMILAPKLNGLSIQEMRDAEKVWGFTVCKTGDANFFMAVFGNDDGVALRFYNNGHYEKFTTNLWSKLSRSSNVILDVGAHTGSYTLSARVASPTSKVISFEPHYLNFGRLALNLRANGFDAVDIFMIAASDNNKSVNFQVPKDLGYHSSGGKITGNSNIQDFDGYWVNCVSIDDFLIGESRNNIDLVKIDTEGHELKVLYGMSEIININHPTVFFECITENNKELEVFFKNHGYIIYCVDDDHDTLIETDVLIPYYNEQKLIDMSKLNRIAIHKSNSKHFEIVNSVM